MDAIMQALEKIRDANLVVRKVGEDMVMDEEGNLKRVDRKRESNSMEGEWAAYAIRELKARSPTSLNVTLRLLYYGQNWSIDEAFQREYYLADKFMDHEKHPDFVEGVEKQLSKEKPKPKPTWQPGNLKDVTTEMIDSYFAVNQQLAPMAFVRKDEEPYKQKPYPQGLPSENDIQDALAERSNMTLDTFRSTMLTLFNNKLGLEEKLKDVYMRKCKLDENGFVIWVGPKAFAKS